MPSDFPIVSPYLYYKDGPAALRFLVDAFGFRVRHEPDPQTFGHAEVEIGNGGVVMLGNPPEVDTGARWGGLYVYVEDFDAHHEQARAAGATIVSGPDERPYGDRVYETRDPEGHVWWFAQPVASRG